MEYLLPHDNSLALAVFRMLITVVTTVSIPITEPASEDTALTIFAFELVFLQRSIMLLLSSKLTSVCTYCTNLAFHGCIPGNNSLASFFITSIFTINLSITFPMPKTCTIYVKFSILWRVKIKKLKYKLTY